MNIRCVVDCKRPAQLWCVSFQVMPQVYYKGKRLISPDYSSPPYNTSAWFTFTPVIRPRSESHGTLLNIIRKEFNINTTGDEKESWWHPTNCPIVKNFGPCECCYFIIAIST